MTDWLFPLSGVGLAAVCLLISAFLSAAKAALKVVSRPGMERLVKQGNPRAAIIIDLLNRHDHTLSALLIGNAIAITAATTLITCLLMEWQDEIGALYAFVLMSVLIILAQALPQRRAGHAPDRFALASARSISVMAAMLSPLATLLSASLDRFFGARRGGPGHAARDTSRENGADRQERGIASGLVDLNELQVSDVMVHRTEMVTVNAGQSADDLIREVLATEFTRVPLWRDKPENIIGVLHVKDLLRRLRAVEGDASRIDISTIALPPWFVPEMRPLPEQLKAFHRRKTHFALVVDEYGEVEGLITLEDILAEIVGDISDERDIVVPGVRPQPDGSVVVDGSVAIRDLDRAMDWRLPDEEATTIAGLVIHEAQSIPDRGQSFTFHGFRFQVLRRERNRIAVLRITPVADESNFSGSKPKVV